MNNGLTKWSFNKPLILFRDARTINWLSLNHREPAGRIPKRDLNARSDRGRGQKQHGYQCNQYISRRPPPLASQFKPRDPQPGRRHKATLAHHRRRVRPSMEAEARAILRQAMSDATPPRDLAAAVRARIAPLGGADLDAPAHDRPWRHKSRHG